MRDRTGLPDQYGAVTPAISALELHGAQFGVHEYDRGDELRGFGREAAEALGVPFDQVFKTLLLELEHAEGTASRPASGSTGGAARQAAHAVAVVPVSCMVSLKRAAAAVGAKRARMCDPAVAERLTGYVVGGMSPFGQRTSLPTVLDETVELFDRIYVSGGRRGLDVSVAPTDLVELLDATVAPITA